MVATTRHRKRESPSQLRRSSSAADENAPARGRRGASHDHEAPQRSVAEKSKGKSSSASAAAVARKQAHGGTRGRPRASGVQSGSDDDDDNNQGIFPTKKQRTIPSKINEEVGSDSDDAPEEISKGAAQQFHEQAAAAIRMASKPDLAAKRAEKDRLRAATQAAQAAASRRKAADAAALEELPQDVLNAAAAVTLTLQQSLAAPRTNHIPLLPEIPKKVTSRWLLFLNLFPTFLTIRLGSSTVSTCRTCRCLTSTTCHPPYRHHCSTSLPPSLFNLLTSTTFQPPFSLTLTFIERAPIRRCYLGLTRCFQISHYFPESPSSPGSRSATARRHQAPGPQPCVWGCSLHRALTQYRSEASLCERLNDD